MATLTVPDEVLRQAGLSEREALLEFACRLFDAGRLSLWTAAQLAGLDRNGMEDALLERNIPIYRPTAEDLAQDLANLDRLGLSLGHSREWMPWAQQRESRRPTHRAQRRGFAGASEGTRVATE